MPSDSFYAKNSIGLSSFIEIDDLQKTGKNDFLEIKIFDAYKKRSVENYELAGKFNSLISFIEGSIEDLKSAEDVNNYIEELPKLQHIWSSLLVGKHKLADKATALGLKFNKEAKKYV